MPHWFNCRAVWLYLGTELGPKGGFVTEVSDRGPQSCQKDGWDEFYVGIQHRREACRGVPPLKLAPQPEISHMAYKSDIEIAREAQKKPIQDIGAKIGIDS